MRGVKLGNGVLLAKLWTWVLLCAEMIARLSDQCDPRISSLTVRVRVHRDWDGASVHTADHRSHPAFQRRSCETNAKKRTPTFNCASLSWGLYTKWCWEVGKKCKAFGVIPREVHFWGILWFCVHLPWVNLEPFSSTSCVKMQRELRLRLPCLHKENFTVTCHLTLVHWTFSQNMVQKKVSKTTRRLNYTWEVTTPDGSFWRKWPSFISFLAD